MPQPNFNTQSVPENAGIASAPPFFAKAPDLSGPGQADTVFRSALNTIVNGIAEDLSTQSTNLVEILTDLNEVL
jgi:hypothetical protein